MRLFWHSLCKKDLWLIKGVPVERDRINVANKNPITHARSSPNLSVCMIVKNEEENLGDCLKSIRGFADQIVVVDTGSTDNTVKIANTYGACVIHSDWRDDFSYSRNISLDHATKRWILWLDADDRVPLTEVEKINKLKTASPNRAFYLKIRNVKPGGFGEQWFQLRIFPNHPALRFERKVHEQIGLAVKRLGLQVLRQDVRIEHVGYQDPEAHRLKAIRNRRILLAEIANYKDDPAYISSLGDSYFITGEFSEAIRWYQEVLKISQLQAKQPDLYNQMPISIALSYERIKKLPEALMWIERSLATNPQKVDSLFLGAEIKENLGDLAGAIDLYEKVLKAPGSPNTYAVDYEGLKARALVQLGGLNRRFGDSDKAEQAYRLCLGKYPNVLNAYSELGELLLQKNQYEEAVNLFRQSIDRRRNGDIKAYLGWAKALLLMGNPQEAVNVLEESRRIFANPQGAEVH